MRDYNAADPLSAMLGDCHDGRLTFVFATRINNSTSSNSPIQLLTLKEQYPITARAPNFDFRTGCREIKR